MTTHDIELPPLPPLHIAPSVEPVDYPKVAQALMDYAHAAIEADRKHRGEDQGPFGYIQPLSYGGADSDDYVTGWNDCCFRIAQEGKRRGEPTAAEISDVIREITGCPDIKNGEDSLVVALGMLFHRCATTRSSEPDYKQLFEQMCERCDALDAKLAEYSEREPVGYIMPTAIKQLKAGGNAIVGGVSQGCDVPIYTAPQPAEPCASSVSDKTACGSENGDCDSQPAEPVKERPETTSEHIARDIREGRFPGKSERQTVPAEPVKVPSDSAIMFEWSQTPNTGDMRVDLVAFARALLARYGQPAEPVKRKHPYAQGTALGEFGVIPMCDQVDDEPVNAPPATTYCQHSHCQTTGGCQGPCSKKPAEPTPAQIRRARLRADPVKAAALDRAKERIAAELANSADPVKVPSMIDLIADDAYAATFQSVGQYRKALFTRYGGGTP